jgi:Tfp pilus assembly protein PilZ
MPGNYAARFRCPVCEGDSWVTLPDRQESHEQILEQTWDFKCRYHGPQKGIPKEVIETAPLNDSQPAPKAPPISAVPIPLTPPAKKIPRSSERLSMRVPVVVYGFTKKSGAFHEDTETITVNASGALVMLKAKLELGDSVFLIHKASRHELEVRVAYLDPYSDRETKVGLAFKCPIHDFWRKSRKQPRTPKSLKVVVKGTDSKGHRFVQTAYTVDLSQDGARLDGVGFLTTPGQTIEIRRLWRKKRFRVVWIGPVGTSESNQVGVFGVESEKDIWHVPLSEDNPAKPSGKSNPPKK